ncbi:MAG: hypothetical protein NTY63_07275 [Candidatus Bipolaricaulota bacterium]|nr:hypothetical protein [Candidatus Bipolaricaulota bacterium]
MTGRRRLKGFAVFLALAGLLAGHTSVCLASTFDVVVGLAGRVVPERLAPIHLTLTGLPSGAARLRVTQNVGNAWRGETTMSFEIPLAESDRGDFEEIIPIYDAALPLRLELLSADERRLAEREVDLRSRRVDAPFPVGVGAFSAPLPGQAASLSSAELPKKWSAYDAAESVWIGRTRGGLDGDQWDALARWVFSGGSLVVFTGADFFLLDAPRLRDLLPVANPTLTERGDGVRVLTGDLRSGATLLATKEKVPWLVERRYGAGNVLLVTADAFTVDDAELAEIRSHVSSAGALQLAGAASDLLDQQPIDHPGRWVATLLTVLAVVALPAVIGRLEGRRSAAPALCAVFAALALFAGVCTDSARVGSDLYRTNASVSIEGSLGVSVSCSALCSAARQPVTVRVGVDAVPYEPLPRSFESGSYDMAYRDGAAQITLAPGGRRFLIAESDAPVRLRARLAGDEELRLTSRGSRILADALLLLDGEVFVLPPLEPGEVTIYLANPSSESTRSLGPEGGSLDRLLAAAADSLPLRRGAWLVAGEITETKHAESGVRTRVRDVSLYVVEVERD